MWIDPTVKTNDENQDLQAMLRSIGIHFEAYDTLEDGKAAIERLTEFDQVYLVISGQFSKTLMPSIHGKQQISNIVVFCYKQEEYLEWAKQYDKIKHIVKETRALKSLLERHHQELRNSTDIVPSSTPDADNLYAFNDLVVAGELQYIEKRMNNIALEVIEEFGDNISQEFDCFLDRILRSIMYLLKREQNLKVFVETIRDEFENQSLEMKISQRYLIDMLITHSNRYLHRRLLTLLSKRNPIPMIQPPIDSTANSDYRLLSDIVHVWNFQKPMLLSFGIEKVDGKSTLLNQVFLCSFDDSTQNKYFHGTIDLDFGYSFTEQRPVNIADVHGTISIDRLKQVSGIFSGFLIHIDWKFLLQNNDCVAKYLKSLGNEKYVQLIIRDVENNDVTKIKSLESMLCSDYPWIKIASLPDISNTQKRGITDKLNKIRETIFGEVKSCRMIVEQEIRTILDNLSSTSERTLNEQNKRLFDEIRSILIDGADGAYPLYALYANMSQKRLEISKKDPYKANFHDSEIFKLHCESYQADCKFTDAQSDPLNASSEDFQKFFTLLRDPKSRLANLSLLGMELLKKRENMKPNKEGLPFYENLSIELHWRNAFLRYNSIDEAEKNILVDAYYDYIMDGNPFEIIDGDNFQMERNVLKKVFERLQDKRIFVITVVGPQNSGKSTLLNCLFGTSFEARDGRCTKGMYGTLVDVSRVKNKEELFTLEYDYILAVDSEGILATEKDDSEYSKRLLLFCLAVSHLILINTAGEIDETMTKLILLCTQSLKYIGVTRVKNPIVHLLRNKRDALDSRGCEELLKLILAKLKENELENIIRLDKKSIHELQNSFMKTNLSISNKNYTSMSIDESFVMTVQKLGRLLIDESSQIIKENDDRFIVPAKWIEHVGQVFTAIKRHPEIAKFQEIYERQEFDKLRKIAKGKLDSLFSQDRNKKMIEEYKLKNIEDIKQEFEKQQTKTSVEFFNALNKHRSTYRITDESYKRLSDLFKVTLNNRFRSLTAACILASRKYFVDSKLNEVESKCRAELTKLTVDECSTDEQSARTYLHKRLNEIIPEITTDSNELWENAKNIASYLWLTFDIDFLPNATDLIQYEPFLESLDPSNNQRVSIDHCLNKIHEKWIQLTSEIHWIVGEFNTNSLVIPNQEFFKSYTYLESQQLEEIHNGLRTNSRSNYGRASRIICHEKFEERQKEILKVKKCFETLTEKMRTIFSTINVDDYDVGFPVGEAVICVGKELIQEFDNELGVFDFRLSNEFRSIIYTYIVISTIIYYYIHQKNYYIQVIEDANTKRKSLIEQFLPLILIKTEQDERYGINIFDFICKHLLKSFENEIGSMMHRSIEESKETLEKRFIINELDKRISAHGTEDDWIIQYITDPIKTINEQFDTNWNVIKSNIVKNSKVLQQKYLRILANISELIEKLDKQLKEKQLSRINFVNELFDNENQQNNNTIDISNKRVAMAKLLYLHLTGHSSTEKLIINQENYKINPVWFTIVSGCEPNEDVRHVWILTEREWKNIEISYPEIFLRAIHKQKDNNDIQVEMEKIIDQYQRWASPRF